MPSALCAPLSRAIVYHPPRPSGLQTTTVTIGTLVSAPGSCSGFHGKRSLGVVWMTSSSPASNLKFPNCGRRFCNEGSRRARSILGPDGSPREVE